MRIPQLAIHLDRGVNDEGLKLDKQQHTAPVWSVGRPELQVLSYVADQAGCDLGGDRRLRPGRLRHHRPGGLRSRTGSSSPPVGWTT